MSTIINDTYVILAPVLLDFPGDVMEELRPRVWESFIRLVSETARNRGEVLEAEYPQFDSVLPVDKDMFGAGHMWRFTGTMRIRPNN